MIPAKQENPKAATLRRSFEKSLSNKTISKHQHNVNKAHRICPFKFTGKFYEKIRTQFYVSNFSRAMDLIKRQFLSGHAVNVGGDSWLVQVKDIPAIVVVNEGTLITINWCKHD